MAQDRRGPVYLNLFRYWLKIFAIVFAMGVVSGIVMSYQFGTNWSVFSDKAGPVIGPLMAYEVLTAFFLEAGFLGVMLFGHGEGGARACTSPRRCMVALGTAALGVLDSRREQLDADARRALRSTRKASSSRPASWSPIIFNPSFPYRLVHTVIAAYLTTALVVGGVGAWHLLKRPRHRRGAHDVLDGDVDGGAGRAGPDRRRRPAWAQHARASAGQDRWRWRAITMPSRRRAADPVRPSRSTEATVHHALGIPQVSSLILKHDPERAGRRARRPAAKRIGRRSAIVFWSFRIMVGLGLLMFAARAC